MQDTLVRRLAFVASALALAGASTAAQLSVTPSYPSYGQSVSVELRDTSSPTYLQATRYSRTGLNIAVEYEYATEELVAGRADFGNPVLEMGELVPGTYSVEARLFKMGDPSVAAIAVTQEIVVLPPEMWGIYLIPREPEAFVPTDVLIRSAVYFQPGSMQVTVSGNVVRVDFDYHGNAPVGGRMPSGSAAFAAARIPALAPGGYVVEGWGRDNSGGRAERYFARAFRVSASVPVVEYYSEARDHYMMPASPSEIAMLDSGALGPWKRTGQQFRAWLRMGDGPASALPVCRFRVAGSGSYFYTSTREDCADLMALEAEQRTAAGAAGMPFFGWAYQNIAFYALRPESGECPAGTAPVYRAYNERARDNDANHRFTADPRQRAAMAMSWTDEGIAFCSPRRPG